MAQQRRLGYLPALDGVRGVAILSVLGFHLIGRPAGGFLGVHVFFVLSGFLITTLLLEEWDARGGISLRHFYYRRALRLLPALAVALIGFAIIAATLLAIGHAPPSLTARGAEKGVLFGALYVSNIAQAAGTSLPGSIGHLWSLATEEQFYVLWPVCLVAALRLGLSRRAIGAGLVTLIAVVAAHRLEMTIRGVPQQRIYFAPDGSFDLLLIGCLAGVILTSAGDQALAAVRRACRWGWLPSAAVVAAAILVSQPTDRAVYEWLLPLFGIAVALLLLVPVLDARSLLARVLSLGPLVYVGQISYGIYLWHQIINGVPLNVSFAAGYGRFALVTAITIALASASYHLVERPFLRRKRRDREQLLGAPEVAHVLATT